MEDYKEEIENLINSILNFYKIDKDSLFGETRKAHIVEARHVLAYCLREKFKLSFPAIGAMFNRDHTSIMHAHERISNLIITNNETRSFIGNITEGVDKHYNNLNLGLDRIDNKRKVRQYVIAKYQTEKKKYCETLKKINEDKKSYIKKAKEEYWKAVNVLESRRKKDISEYEEAISLLKEGKFIEAKKYLSYQKELTEFNNEKDYRKLFPAHKKAVQEYSLPIKFNTEYIHNVFNNLDDRSKSILFKRYGFIDQKTSTLEEVAISENITRERVRQIILKQVDNIYFNNYGGLRQVICAIAERVINENIVSIRRCLNNYYIYQDNEEPLLIKFLLVMFLSFRWVKEFDFAGNKFLINSYNEVKIIEIIDQIKILISKIDSSMPDLIENRWEYILNNLKFYEYFQDKKHLLDENFLRACYDNYLFESEIIVYKTEHLKKYNSNNDKIINNTKGVPDEYKVFFE